MDCSTAGFPVLHYPGVCSNLSPLSQWCHSFPPLCLLLHLPSIFSSIRVFSNELALCIIHICNFLCISSCFLLQGSRSNENILVFVFPHLYPHLYKHIQTCKDINRGFKYFINNLYTLLFNFSPLTASFKPVKLIKTNPHKE